LLVIFELAAHGRRNNDSHGVETANYYYLKVYRKYLSTSFSTQSTVFRRDSGDAYFLQTVLKHSFSAAMTCLMLNIALGLSQWRGLGRSF
jgi:hypothetical protein